MALQSKEGASHYFPSCEFSFFEGLIQRKTGKKKKGGGGGGMSEFISVSGFGTQILHTCRDAQGYVPYSLEAQRQQASVLLRGACPIQSSFLYCLPAV